MGEDRLNRPPPLVNRQFIGHNGVLWILPKCRCTGYRLKKPPWQENTLHFTTKHGNKNNEFDDCRHSRPPNPR